MPSRTGSFNCLTQTKLCVTGLPFITALSLTRPKTLSGEQPAEKKLSSGPTGTRAGLRLTGMAFTTSSLTQVTSAPVSYRPIVSTEFSTLICK